MKNYLNPFNAEFYKINIYKVYRSYIHSKGKDELNIDTSFASAIDGCD